jgi:protein pelota
MNHISHYQDMEPNERCWIIQPQTGDGIWYTYRSIMPGDYIRVKYSDFDYKRWWFCDMENEVPPMRYLTIVKFEFRSDQRGTMLVVHGNENDPTHRHRDEIINSIIEIKPLMKLQILKQEYNEYVFEKIKEGLEFQFQKLNSIIVLFDDGYVCFHEVKKNFTNEYGKIVRPLTKKRSGKMDIYNKNIEEFDRKIWRHIFETLDPSAFRAVIIAGPGHAKNRFLDRLKNYKAFEKDSKLVKMADNFRDKFVMISTNSTSKFAINEIMKDPKGKNLLEYSKAVKEVESLDNFFETLQKNPNCAVYGNKDVAFACKSEAIKLLLISDVLLRSSSSSQRKKYKYLMEETKVTGGEVCVLNEDHFSGHMLGELSGIAATLNFPINLELADEYQIENFQEIRSKLTPDEIYGNEYSGLFYLTDR